MTKDATKKDDLDGETLTREQVESTKKDSITDACAHNVMVGFGEQYVTAYALRLGASNSEIGILSSVPSFVGSVFQVVGARLTDKFQNRKKVVLWFVLLQILMYIPLFIVPFLTKNILLLTIIFALYLMVSNGQGPAWNSWIGQVIPNTERAEYFSKRNRTSLIFLLLSVLLAGVILNYFTSRNIWLGFGILFAIAFIGKTISFYYLTKQFEPKYHTTEEEKFTFRQFLKRMPETNFGNFVMFRSIFAFAVMIASPFFAVYMLKDLGFSYIQYTIVLLIPMLVKIITVTYWGKYSKKIGTRNIMIVSAFLIAFIPLVWAIAGYFLFGHPEIFLIIIIAESISGFGWAGFELSTFNYILETVSPPKRARATAYFNIVFGTTVLLGGLLGSYLAITLPDRFYGISILLMVFIISAVARFIVPILFIKKLKEVNIEKTIDEKKLFMDLVISKPLHSALHHTGNLMFFTEEKVVGKARKGLKKVTRPIKPIMDKMMEGLDAGLEKMEPLRKAMEPKIVRDSKMRNYEELVNAHNHDSHGKTYSEKMKNRRRRDDKS